MRMPIFLVTTFMDKSVKMSHCRCASLPPGNRTGARRK